LLLLALLQKQQDEEPFWFPELFTAMDYFTDGVPVEDAPLRATGVVSCDGQTVRGGGLPTESCFKVTQPE